MSEALTLYDTQGSPCARRVRIALLEKRLSWTTRIIDLTKMEQKNPEYLKLNPNGVVPTLVHGERVITGLDTVGARPSMVKSETVRPQ